jgi:hypothetical protein
VCPIPDEQRVQSINVGAAYKLKENEKIYVAFSHLNPNKKWEGSF